MIQHHQYRYLDKLGFVRSFNRERDVYRQRVQITYDTIRDSFRQEARDNSLRPFPNDLVSYLVSLIDLKPEFARFLRQCNSNQERDKLKHDAVGFILSELWCDIEK